MRYNMLCLLVLVSVGAWAQPPQRYNTVGSGANSCGHYLEVQSGPQTPENVLTYFTIVSWTQGYISGMNAYRVMQNPK
jgi:hypothetical protein